MTKPVPSSSLSATDAAFLYLERKEIPLHIASVCVFDGPIPFREFVASVNARLDLVPRYRQVPVVQPWNLSLPIWQDDRHFDIHRHVFHVHLKSPGGEKELQSLAGRLLSNLLDRNKPLWDVHVVDGLKGGRGALIWRVHHALADGVTGAELMKIMLDATPEGSRIFRKPRRQRAQRRAAKTASTPGISGFVNTALESLLEVEASVLDFTQFLLDGRNRTALKEIIELFPEYSASIERLPFNRPCTGARKFCWTEWDIAEVQAMRQAAGGTINDVILTLLTRALASYVKLHGESVVNRFVRIVCPVNLRRPDQDKAPGNQISFLPVAIPMDARGPVQMLRAVTARTEKLKRCGALGIAGLAMKWLATVPAPLQALFWRSIPEIILPVPLLNMICTNVAGSPTPLYAMGRRMLAAYPQVPTGYDLGLGCAVHSYDGKLFVGIIADTHAAPDVERLRDFLNQSFHELRGSVLKKKERRVKRTTVKTRKRGQKPVKPVQTATSESTNVDWSPAPDSLPVVERNGEAA